MVTKLSNLIALANPELGFIRNIRMTENVTAGYSFANGWVSSPPLVVAHGLHQERGPMPVSGRGKSREEALNVMMLEAVERNCCVFTGREQLIEGKAGDVSAEQWRRWLPFSNRQIANRKPVAREAPEWVGESLGKKTRIRFCEAVSAVDGKQHLIPAAMVYLGYSFAGEPDYACADSNGCAAGETKDDAILRGMLELIERDAFGLWWFNRAPCPGLDFAGDKVIEEIAAALDAEGRRLQLIDLTHDLETPVVAAVNADASGGAIYIGCAAALSKKAAARKASLEALGFWFWGKVGVDPPSRVQWLSEATFKTQPWLKPERQRELRNEAGTSLDSSGLAARLARRGFEPLIIDMTKDYFEIPVVRVMAAGLRSQRPQFAPGRLYDLPVQLGWLKENRREEELSGYCSPL